MSEELKAKVRRLIDECWDKDNLDVLNELCAANYVRHQPPFPDVVGREAFRKYLAELHVSYPDFHLNVVDITADGHTTVTWGTWEGTQKGTSPTTGAPGSGKKVKVSYCAAVRWVNGQAVEEWSVSDWLTFFEQLGVTPPQFKK